jgi:hypothetical protein
MRRAAPAASSARRLAPAAHRAELAARSQGSMYRWADVTIWLEQQREDGPVAE